MVAKSCALRTRDKGGREHKLEIRKDDVANALTSVSKDSLVMEDEKMTEIKVAAIMNGGPWDKRHESIRRVYDPSGIAPTVTAGGGGGTETKTILFDGVETKGDDCMTEITEVVTKDFTYVSLFSGVGGFEQALNQLGGTCVMASEIDKFANQAYEAVYGHKTVGDITKVDAKDVPDHDVLVGGFPCQSFSVAGKRGGFEDARGTLFFEMARIAAEKKPKMILAENVKGLVSHDKGKTLDTIVKTLNEIGYRVDFEILNSKYFGVPQNRERIFLCAIREDLIENEPWNNTKGSTVVPKGKRRISEYADIKMFNFDWPEQTEVTKRLVDILETTVDEKYYLSDEKTAQLVAKLDEVDKEGAPNVVHNIYGGFKESKPRVFKDESPTIRTGVGGGHLPSVLEEGLPIREATQKGYAVACEGDAVNIQFPKSKTRRGRIGKQIANTIEATPGNQGVVEQFSEGDGVSCCVDANYAKGTSPGDVGKGRRTHVVESAPKYRIRKLTPLECFRLQGFSDEVHQAIVDAGISDSQRYKMAGNAVTVNAIKALGERMLPYL